MSPKVNSLGTFAFLILFLLSVSADRTLADTADADGSNHEKLIGTWHGYWSQGGETTLVVKKIKEDRIVTEFTTRFKRGWWSAKHIGKMTGGASFKLTTRVGTEITYVLKPDGTLDAELYSPREGFVTHANISKE